MKYEIERLKGQVKFTFDVEPNEWEDAVNKVYLKTKNKYNVQGFRRGHATRKMIEMAYGASVFFDEAFSDCVNEYYSKALDENEDVFPVEQPHIEIEKFDGKALKFTALVTVKPEVKLGAYSGLEIAKVEYKVTDAEVDSEVEKARERLSRRIEITDREVQNGDIVNLDFCGKIDGVAFEGGTAQNQELVIGSGTFIPGFEEQMIGMKLGDTKDLNVKFPENYGAENLAGKDAVFTVTVNKIFFKELPEINDAFASDVSKFETLSEYKEDIKNRILKDKEQRAKVANENNLITEVVKNAEVEIPECMIESQLDNIVQDFEYRLQYMYRGMKLDDYFKYTGTDLKEFRKERKSEAEDSVKTRLVIEQIIKEQKIEVNDEDFNKKIAELAEQSKKSVEEFQKDLNESQKNYIRHEALMDKTIFYLESVNKFVAEKSTKTAKKTAAKSDTAKNSETETEKEAATAKPKKTTAKKTMTETEKEAATAKPKKATAKKTVTETEKEAAPSKPKKATTKKSDN